MNSANDNKLICSDNNIPAAHEVIDSVKDYDNPRVIYLGTRRGVQFFKSPISEELDWTKKSMSTKPYRFYGKTFIGYSKISWTGDVHNFVTGCTKCSAGCEHCWAESFSDDMNRKGIKRYENKFEFTFHQDVLDEIVRWRRPRFVFAPACSDLFHPKVSDEQIIDAFKKMASVKHSIFLICTKRIERVLDRLSAVI